jgi:signal peptidase
MEIAPVPRRPPLPAAGRVLTVLALLLPVTVLTLVPVMLGMDRYVVTGDAMDGVMGRGSLIYARPVPVSDLEVGDVITFTPPGAASGTRVTRRVVALEGLTARTQGDSEDAPDPWTLALEGPTQSKVVLAVPWVGYPFSGAVGTSTWTLLGVGAAVGLLALLAPAVRRRRAGGGMMEPTS